MLGTYSGLFIKIAFVFLDGSFDGFHSICQTLEPIFTIQGRRRYHIKWSSYQINLKTKSHKIQHFQYSQKLKIEHSPYLMSSISYDISTKNLVVDQGTY